MMRKKKIISSSNIPYFPKGDIKMILKTIKSVLENRQVMQGKYVEEFERRFAKFVGAIQISNGVVNLNFFIIGIISSFIFGILTIKYFLAYLSSQTLYPFIVYRIIIGLLLLFFLI